jgi:methyl-accepting chemotaxis protein
LERSLKTKIALAFYYIAVGFLVACAAVIVLKLIFWPPCTQIGNTCAIDPWSTAGLAGTVLAVSATLLAILGAVAVAAWWTSLNDRVNEQVTKLYESQKTEVDAQVDGVLTEQQQKVDERLDAFRATFVEVNNAVERMQSQIDQTLQNSEDAKKRNEATKELINTTESHLNELKEALEEFKLQAITLRDMIAATPTPSSVHASADASGTNIPSGK